MKKFYLLFALILCAFAVNAKNLYLKTDKWTEANARFEVYTWANGNQWKTLEKALLSDYFVAEIPDGATDFVLVRKDPSKATASWDGEWNRYQPGENAYGTKNCVVESNWQCSMTTISSAYPDKLYVISSTNNGQWDLTKGTELAKVADGVYEGTFLVIGGSTEYVIITSVLGKNTGDWTTVNQKRVGPSADGTSLVEDESYNLGATDGASWKISNDDEGREVTVTVDLVNKTMFVSGLTTKIEVVGVDAGEAVYYNLQGVKVANPENGIFIKKQGNKTLKVVL